MQVWLASTGQSIKCGEDRSCLDTLRSREGTTGYHVEVDVGTLWMLMLIGTSHEHDAYHYQNLISNTGTSPFNATQATSPCPPSCLAFGICTCTAMSLHARTHVTQPYQPTAHRLAIAIDPLIFHARFAAHTLDVSVQGQSKNIVLAI